MLSCHVVLKLALGEASHNPKKFDGVRPTPAVPVTCDRGPCHVRPRSVSSASPGRVRGPTPAQLRDRQLASAYDDTEAYEAGREPCAAPGVEFVHLGARGGLSAQVGERGHKRGMQLAALNRGQHREERRVNGRTRHRRRSRG